MTDKSALDDLFNEPEPSKFLSTYLSTKITDLKPDFDEPEPQSSKQKQPEEPEVDEEERNKRTLFLGNLPTKATAHQIKSLIGNNLVESVRIRNIAVSDKKLKKQVAVRRHLIDEEGTCSAYVVMKNESDVDEAINKFNGYKFMENTIRADHATMKGQKNKIDNTINRKSVFVGHIPFDATEDDIRGIFENCGKIDHVRLLRDEKGKSRGVCYVTFESEDAIPWALQFNGSEFKKEKLTVQRSNPGKAEKTKKKKEQAENLKKERKLAKKDKPTGKFGNRKKRYQVKPGSNANTKAKSSPRSKSAEKGDSKNAGKKTDTSFEGRRARASKSDEKNQAIRNYIKMRAHVNKKRKEASS
ncbi:RNA-binding protein 34 [Tritrichomonas musculus]|uniref:RNA-binding protein 34 n=1 Tax=Tritrichomonas musculus TaxID=1915356 RepID=A0ABR2HW02_9EUKA